MAIIQISRIQVRRGRENRGTGVPKLASGEFGWAIDTQRLYIGSGSTQEGAPNSAENVRILTENDNILNLKGQYFYKALYNNGEIEPAMGTIGRSIQERLDDVVSVKNFGVEGNRSLDVTNFDFEDDFDQLQAAIDFHYGPESDTNSREILFFPSGIYKIREPLKIPPNTILKGAGIDNTIIIGKNGIFEFVDKNGNITSTDFDNKPRHNKISDMSLGTYSREANGILLTSCSDSLFENLEILCFEPFDPLSEIIPDVSGIKIDFGQVRISRNNIFKNITIRNFTKGITAPDEIENNKFLNMNFLDLSQGIEFGTEDDSLGPRHNIIENSYFRNIQKQGFRVLSGDFNVSRNNKYINVGNDGGGDPVYPVIEFLENPQDVGLNTNLSIDDYFERTEDLTESVPDAYVPEIKGRVRYKNSYMLRKEFSSTGIDPEDPFAEPSSQPFIHLPITKSGTIFVDYVMNFEIGNNPPEPFVREGILGVTWNGPGNQPIISDSFTSMGNSEQILGIEFSVDQIGEDFFRISIFNSVINLQNANFYYTIRTKT